MMKPEMNITMERIDDFRRLFGSLCKLLAAISISNLLGKVKLLWDGELFRNESSPPKISWLDTTHPGRPALLARCEIVIRV
jgi:hypothetical protein